MTPTQAVDVVRLISERCPASRLAEATADAWYYDLVDIDYTDAHDAVLAISRRQAFVNLHELIAESSTIARARLGAIRAAQLEAEKRAELEANPPGQIPAGAVLELVASFGHSVAPATKDEIDNERRLAKIAEARAELDSRRGGTA